MQRVAAAIVHYGRPAATARCLDALRRSEVPVDVWIVDNGPPGSLTTVDTGPATRIDPGGNVGYGAALNRVAARLLRDGSHDALLCLNNDALVETGTVGRLAEALAEDDRRAVAVPRIVLDDGTDRLWYGGGKVDWRKGSARVAGVGGSAGTAAALRSRDVGFATGCALLARLDALARDGGFDARYFLYEEDVELSLRLRAGGWTLRYVPEALVRHAGQGSQRAPGETFVPIHRPDNPRAERLAELQVCNRLLTVRRHATPGQRLAFGLWSPLHWSRRCLGALVSGRPGVATALVRGLRRYRRLRGRPPATELFAEASGGAPEA